MKKLLILPGILFFLLVLGISCNKAGKSVHINARFDQAAGDTFYLSRILTEQLDPLDTLIADESGSFRWKGFAEQSGFYLLDDGGYRQLTLVIHPGDKLKLTGSIDDPMSNMEIVGSVDSGRLLLLNRSLTGRLRQLDSLVTAYQDSLAAGAGHEYLEVVEEAAMNIFEAQREFNKQFIMEDISSLANMVALYQNISYQRPVLDIMEDYKYFTMVDSALFLNYPGVEPVQALRRNMSAMQEYFRQARVRDEVLDIGKEAPDIRLPSPGGDTISLSSFRGNVVLLDFWAAWCPPCRQENPNLVNNFSKYSDKGFHIFQVSLDQDRESWLEGIRKDELGLWSHVSDLKYWESEVVPLYFLESIPASYLLDREGKIIGKNMRGEALGIKLAEIFENP